MGRATGHHGADPQLLDERRLYASGGDGNCLVDLVQHYGDWCDGTSPMRVCVGHSDPLGNLCNWTQCGLDTATPQEYFGGCQNNPTAGALCCPS